MSKLFFHFSVEGFSNTYLLGPENGGDAVIFDPGTFDVHLLNLIEKNKFYIKHIFISHDHESHVRGLSTLRKVYDAQIHSASKTINMMESNVVKDGQTINAGEYSIKAIEVQGHSSDSLVFMCENMLFTGDVLSAGNIGKTADEYLHQRLIDEIRSKLFILDDNFFIFPGHGPPTTLEAEKKFNLYLGSKCG
ncbi:MAG: MBL fold metallo-hydrolase [Spirochaetales bacterium]|nr:MBL fold metallo-hydrolase [Spirochaetales bacterium]